MFQPKLIEKENGLQCRSQHAQSIEFVILDQDLQNDQRLICKACENISHSNVGVIEYELLKQCFEDLQREKIKSHESIITPHIYFTKKLQEIFQGLKVQVNQKLDSLILHSQNLINEMTDSITSYSFIENLENLITLKEAKIDYGYIMSKLMEIQKDWKIKINLKLQSFQSFPEFKQCQDIIEQLERLTIKQEDDLISLPKVKILENSFYSDLQQLIRTKQSQEALILKDTIYLFKNGDYIPQTIQFSISQTDQQITYTSQDGQVLRIDQVSQKRQLLKKWEQIHNLQWIGQIGQNSKEIGTWTATWQGQKITGIGGQYTIDGKKQGQWVEIIPNYWSQAKVYEFGMYENDMRKGIWKYKYGDKEIKGGEYNLLGLKQGNWIELWNSFQNFSQVTYNGEYNEKGLKVGRWDIIYCYKEKEGSKLIGGGSYDKEDQIKVGSWIELWEQFRDDAQVTFIGKYNNKGMKFGRWDFKLKEQKIRGGTYDKEGQIKIGNWVELWDQFRDGVQVTYNGEYSQQGTKIGKWDVMYYKPKKRKYKKIGGGSYNDQNQKQIGIWVDLDEEFSCLKKVTYKGEYDMIGRKVGIWETFFKGEYDKEYRKVGGGSYDKEGQKKIGLWVELEERFSSYNQITYSGEYNDKNIKIGIWVENDIFYNPNRKCKELNYDQ